MYPSTPPTCAAIPPPHRISKVSYYVYYIIGKSKCKIFKKLFKFLERGRAGAESGKSKQVKELVNQALAEGYGVQEILDNGLIAAIGVVGENFRTNKIFVPEMLIAARAMSADIRVLEPLMKSSGVKPIGTVVIGTVKGDLHDIGKNLVTMMLQGIGATVYDLGVDVPDKTFVEKAEEIYPEINFTLPAMPATAETFPEAKRIYQEIITGVLEKARQLYAPGIVVEFETLPQFTEHPEWGIEIHKPLRDTMFEYEAKYGLKSALRMTPNDLREMVRPPVMRGNQYWDAMVKVFEQTARDGAGFLTIESTGGKEINDEAITGTPIALEGKSCACAHFSPIGNIAASVADLWSNESVQQVKLLSGFAPVVSMEQLNVVFEIANEIIKTQDPFTRTLNTGKLALEILQRGVDKKELTLDERKLRWIGTLRDQLDEIPEDEQEFICEMKDELDEGRYNPAEYGI